jgi:hypothetical protein
MPTSNKENISNNNFFGFVYNFFLITLISLLVWQYASVFYGNSEFLKENVYGTIERPFVYRQFVPLAARIIMAAGLRIDIAIILIIFLSTIGFAYSLQYLYKSFWGKTSFMNAVIVLGVEFLFLIIVKDKKIYDTSTAFLFTLALGLLAHKKFGSYFLLFPLSCINRETSLLLTIFYAVYFFRKQNNFFYFSSVLFQIVIYLIIRFFLMYYFRNNPGSLIYIRPVENLHLFFSNPLATLSFAIITALILYGVIHRWKNKPIFLRTAFLVFFPTLTILYLVAGVSFEIRVFVEVYPIVFLLILPILVTLLRLKTDPLLTKK